MATNSPRLLLIGFTAAFATLIILHATRPAHGPPMDTPSRLATWPIPGAKMDKPHPGVTHYFATDKDGTTVDFFDFDSAANPKLHWAIYDQSGDAPPPTDYPVGFWERNVASIVLEINARKKGNVLAASNGAFFGYDRKTEKADAFHVSPVVLRGKVFPSKINVRWTFGVKYENGKPVWKLFFKPDNKTLAREFDYAAGGIQCLLKDGKPLLVEPFPALDQPFKKPPVPASPTEAGHIPAFDHMLSCRISLGWSKDNQHLYWLAIKEPDDEGSSIQAVSNYTYQPGGWTVADVQNFWLKQGAWSAINSDAGDAMQMTFKRADGGYTFIPPKPVSPNNPRLNFDANLKGAPSQGGALMYFYVHD